jgi:type III secretion protein Q
MSADINAAPVKTTSLADALPRMSPTQARFQRLVFDARFERWLAERFGISELAISLAEFDEPAGTRIEMSVAGGFVAVAADLTPWPAAQLVLHAGDPSLACALGDALFADAFETMADVATGLRVSAITHAPVRPGPARTPAPRAAAHPVIVVPGLAVTLWSCEGCVHEALLQALQSVPASSAVVGGVRLAGRLRLAQRTLAVATLQGLRRGDVLLLGAATVGGVFTGVLQYGVGTTMQAQTEVDVSEQSVTLTDEPQVAPGDDALEPVHDEQLLPEPLSELMLPVAFEIDTTALSLAELASMRPGYVVELAVPLMEATVRLVCHGQTVGSGQLVAIGDQLGVRINRMSTPHELAAQH